MVAPIIAYDVMVTKLITLSPEMDVHEAIDLLLKHKISGAPVVGAEKNYLGVFSETCCLNVIAAAAYDSLPTNRVDAFYDREARTIEESTDLLQIVNLFRTTGARRLPVLSAEGKLVGQVSRRDIIDAAQKLMKPTQKHQASTLYLSGLRAMEDCPV